MATRGPPVVGWWKKGAAAWAASMEGISPMRIDGVPRDVKVTETIWKQDLPSFMRRPVSCTAFLKVAVTSLGLIPDGALFQNKIICWSEGGTKTVVKAWVVGPLSRTDEGDGVGAEETVRALRGVEGGEIGAGECEGE